ncbi:MAG: hypothetical protein Kow0069_08960 [Promethearchaeota archaeon]
MKVVATWYGTAMLHLNFDDSLGVLFDPSAFRPPAARPVVKFDPETDSLDPLHAVLVSHSHFDHVFHLPAVLERHPDAFAFAPAHALKNCRALCAGETFDDYRLDVVEETWERLKEVKPGDSVQLVGDECGGGDVGDRARLFATAIESAHVHFDWFAVRRILFSWATWRRIRYYLKCFRGFPLGDVVGWDVEVTGVEGDAFRLVFFGSLCKEYPEELARHAGADLFVVPLHGRKEVLPHAEVMTRALAPKAVLPVHFDDFFPPISWPCDVSSYEEWLSREMPRVRYQRLDVEVPTIIHPAS